MSTSKKKSFALLFLLRVAVKAKQLHTEGSWFTDNIHLHIIQDRFITFSLKKLHVMALRKGKKSLTVVLFAL